MSQVLAETVVHLMRGRDGLCLDGSGGRVPRSMINMNCLGSMASFGALEHCNAMNEIRTD